MKKMRFFATFLLSSIILLLASCQDDDDTDISPEEQAPTASFNAPTAGEVGKAILFTDSSTDADGTIVSWSWDFGNGVSSTFQNPDHTYATAGTYEVRLTVTDDSNLSSSVTNPITISDPEPAQTGLLDRTITHDGNDREYALYIPISYTGEQEVPLVLYLHGAPENKELAQATTDFIDVAEAEGFIMVFAEGAASPAPDAYVWADGRGAGAGSIDAAFDDVSFINSLVDELTEEFEINTGKRYVCGFSNGGSLSQRIAFEGNERFAAMATVGAGVHEIYETSDPGRAIPMLFIHGTDDAIASYEEGGITEGNPLQFQVGLLSVPASVDFWVTNNQCGTTPTETDLEDIDTGDNSTVTTFEYTGGTNGAEVKLYRINGGGHTWPGVVNATLRPESNFGVNNNDIKAGQEIWDFFNKFELN